MKTLIFISIFICIAVLSAFSQQNIQGKPDPEKYFKLDEPNQSHLNVDSSFVLHTPSFDSLLKELNHSGIMSGKHFKFQKPQDLGKFRGMVDGNYAMDNMPCYKQTV
jgi:hypothetical protein